MNVGGRCCCCFSPLLIAFLPSSMESLGQRGGKVPIYTNTHRNTHTNSVTRTCRDAQKAPDSVCFIQQRTTQVCNLLATNMHRHNSTHKCVQILYVCSTSVRRSTSTLKQTFTQLGQKLQRLYKVRLIS